MLKHCLSPALACQAIVGCSHPMISLFLFGCLKLAREFLVTAVRFITFPNLPRDGGGGCSRMRLQVVRIFAEWAVAEKALFGQLEDGAPILAG